MHRQMSMEHFLRGRLNGSECTTTSISIHLKYSCVLNQSSSDFSSSSHKNLLSHTVADPPTTSLSTTHQATTYIHTTATTTINSANPPTHLYICTASSWTGECTNLSLTTGQCHELDSSGYNNKVRSAGPDEGTFCVFYS